MGCVPLDLQIQPPLPNSSLYLRGRRSLRFPFALCPDFFRLGLYAITRPNSIAGNLSGTNMSVRWDFGARVLAVRQIIREKWPDKSEWLVSFIQKAEIVLKISITRLDGFRSNYYYTKGALLCVLAGYDGSQGVFITLGLPCSSTAQYGSI